MKKHIFITAVLLITITLTGCTQQESGIPSEAAIETESTTEIISATTEEITTTVSETTEVTTAPVTEAIEPSQTTSPSLTKADIELDGIPYEDLTSQQVLELYIQYLKENELRKATFLWKEKNGMFTGEKIEIIAINNIKIECYPESWLSESGLKPNDDEHARYVWDYTIDYSDDGYKYNNLSFENFIEMEKENGYWKILFSSTSPKMGI